MALGASAAFALLGAGSAAADTFTYTGAEQTYTVPAGITGLHVVLVGAAGATVSSSDEPPGGYAAKLTADLPVSSGTRTLYVEVGGTGMKGNPPTVPDTATGGFNGGGNGGFGGGGASDIRTVSSSQADSLSSRLAVAGGGGGDGAIDYRPFDDGNAGNADGSGNAGGTDISGGGAGVGAAGQPAGQSTVTSYCQADLSDGGETGEAGALGAGGSGAFVLIGGTPLSGGGGGGFYGGAGGAQCYSSPGANATGFAGAGGGGSSGAPGAQNVQIMTDAADPAEVIITAPVPSNTAPPTLSGGLRQGDVVVESNGTWSSTPAVSSYAYQWQRCDASGGSCTAIDGATGKAYTLQPGDVGHTLRVQETATNFYGPASATSLASGVVLGPPPATIDPPTIAGTPAAGQLLIASHAPWRGGPIVGYGDQWERCNAAGNSCQAIAGAVNQTYTLTRADIGSTMRVEETATNANGTSAPVRSAPTAVVRPAQTPHVRLKSARFDGKAVLVKLACTRGGSPCKGNITLRYSRHKLTVVLGRAKYALSPGESKTIKVLLHQNAKRLLKQHHKLPTKGSVTLVPATGKRTTPIRFTLALTQTKKRRT